MEEKNKNVDSIGPKKHVRGIWGVLIIIIVALLVLGGVGYYFYLTDPSQFSALFNRQKVSTSPTPTGTPQASATPSGSCVPNTLNDLDQTIIKGWTTHTNTAGKYEFKHPSSWKVTQEFLDGITMEDSADPGVTFEFLRPEFENYQVDTAGYHNTSTIDTQVFCLDASEKIYEKGSSSPYDYLVVVKFNRDDFPNYLIYRFGAAGASIAGDYIDLFNALIKTFKFLP